MTAKTAGNIPQPDKRRISVQPNSAGERSPGSVATDRRKPARPSVGWITATAITLMLIIGAGWELWRWLLLIATMD